MIQSLERRVAVHPRFAGQQAGGMLAYLRRSMLREGETCERFHAIFLNARQAYLADTAMGVGGHAVLSLRMRDLFGKALAVGASGLIVAHNHPSGDCRPSRTDIDATRRLKDVATALDIELIDHLILTENAAYSMRAGGDL
ncbi:JAB domain-containing protein [Erythrobacter sp. GH1-10]|uniref:JAB domain-containing protein n=1 Tax=Erythrobacter sp. GH1-10 TaxID=3349334 RepID=UPI0038779A74